MKLWDCPGVSSQSKRATNCATPGYEIFQLWSNMWSTPIFDQLPARGKVLSAQVSQGFPGFPRAVARTRASRSQSRRATNCTTPGCSAVVICDYITKIVRLKVVSTFCEYLCRKGLRILQLEMLYKVYLNLRIWPISINSII